MKSIVKLFLICATLSCDIALGAAVKPDAYSFDKDAGCDNRCYYDNQQTKLTDGFYASGYAQYNTGEGWVGWKLANNETVTIDFQFATLSHIDSLTIDAITAYGNVLPSFSLFFLNETGNWSPLNLPTSTWQGHTLNIASSFDSTSIRIQGSSTDGWLLVDEVTFNGAPINSVPNPPSALLSLTALACLAFSRRLYSPASGYGLVPQAPTKTALAIDQIRVSRAPHLSSRARSHRTM